MSVSSVPANRARSRRAQHRSPSVRHHRRLDLKFAESIQNKLLTVLSTHFEERQKYVLFLLIGLAGLGSCLILFRFVPPNSVANWPLFQSYGLLLGAVFCLIWGLCSYVLAHARRGLLLAIPGTILLLLRLQSIELTGIQLISLIGFFIVLELLISLLEHFTFRRQTRVPRRRV